MKNNGIFKIVGIGLSISLIFTLLGVVFATRVEAESMKWTTVSVPSWEDDGIVP